MKKGQVTSKILKIFSYPTIFTELLWESDKIAQKAIPGQFVSILCKNMVLRRPFSVAWEKMTILNYLQGKRAMVLSILNSKVWR